MQFKMETGSLFHPVCLLPQASCLFSWENLKKLVTLFGHRTTRIVR